MFVYHYTKLLKAQLQYIQLTLLFYILYLPYNIQIIYKMVVSKFGGI